MNTGTKDFTTTVGATIEINGSRFRVTSVSDNVISVVGTRGGSHTLVRNLRSRQWIFLRNGREESIRSIAELTPGAAKCDCQRDDFDSELS